MALIYCSACGKQISDKAAACPHCGAVHAPLNTVNTAVPVQPPFPVQQIPMQQLPAKKGNSAQIVLIVIVILLAIALVGVILFFTLGGNDTSQGNTDTSSDFVQELVPPDNYAPPVVNVPPSESSVPSQTTAPAVPQIAIYNVEMQIECEKNAIMNQYDIDILVDGRNFATLAHGTTEVYTLSLAEGSHSIEFRLGSKGITGKPLYDPDDPGSYQVMTLNVSQDMGVRYYAKIALGNTLKVSRQ